MTDLALYNNDLDIHCYKARLLLSCLDVEAEMIVVDVIPGNEHLSPPILAMSPTGSLPVLKHDDLTLFESEAVLAYLAKTFDPARTFLPEEAATYGRVMTWLTFSARELEAAVAARATAMLDAPGDLEALTLAGREALRVMDDHMTLQHIDGLDYFAGATPTIADIALFPAFALSRDFNVDHDAFPALRRWARAVRDLKGFITMPGIPDYH